MNSGDYALKVHLKPDRYARLVEIQSAIGQTHGGIIPQPSLHAMILKAVDHYIAMWDLEEELKSGKFAARVRAEQEP